MNFPHHSYLGPGNKLNNQKHLDKDDLIARLHDEAYEKNPDNVHEEDFIAIHEFANEAKESPHAIVGAAGLGLKYIYETFGGQVYPMPPPPVKRLPDTPLTPPKTPRKIPKFAQEGSSDSNEYSGEDLEELPAAAPSNDENTAAEVTDPPVVGSGPTVATTSNMAGAAGGEPGGTGANRVIMKGRGASKFSVNYHRHFTVTTKSNANATLPLASVAASLNISAQNNLVTPLCPINPNLLMWYMTESEFNLLPAYSFAKKCRIVVRPLNYRSNYETLATNSLNVNSQQPIDILYNVGMNTFMNMSHVKPVFSETEQMKILSVTTETHAEAEANTSLIEKGRMHLQEPYLAYRAMVPENTYLDKYVFRENLIQVKGHPVIDYEYNFKVSPLVRAVNPFVQVTNTTTAAIAAGQINPKTISKSGVGVSDGVYWNNGTNVQFRYHTGIEKAGYMSMQSENNHNTNTVPMIYIGGAAVPSSLPGSTSPTFANCFLTWSIETFLEIECNINIINNNLLLPGLQPQYIHLISSSALETGRHVYSYNGNIMNFFGGYMYNRLTAPTSDNKEEDLSKKIKNVNKELETLDTVLTEIHADIPKRKERLQKSKRAKRKAPDDDDGDFIYKLAVLEKHEGVKDLFDIE